MGFLSQALKALPEIALHPLAFVGYALVVGAWLIVIWRTKRFGLLLSRLDQLPEADRKSMLQIEMDTVIPQTITAEQWLKGQRQRYYLVAFVVTLVAVVALFGFAGSRSAQLEIDDVKVRKEGLRLKVISAALADEVSDNDRATLESTGVTDNKVPVSRISGHYYFYITVRNPSDEPINITDIWIVFDPQDGVFIQSVQELSGTYVVRVGENGSAMTTGPNGAFEAYAWYPHGSGTLYVRSTLTQSLKGRETDRFLVEVVFSPFQKFLGPMKTAQLQLIWNGKEYVRSKLIKLE